MKITILGTGNVARMLCERIVQLGHEVSLETRDPKTTLARPSSGNAPAFSDWMKHLPNTSLHAFGASAGSADLVFNATNGKATLQVLDLVGEAKLEDKILVDLSNPLDFSNGMPPTLFVCNDDSLGEQVQRKLPKTHVIKSLNTMNNQIMLNPEFVPGNHVVFMSGNDSDSKAVFGNFLNQTGWKRENIIDLGDITTARGAEQILPLWIRLWGAMGTSDFNFNIVKK